MQAKLTLSIEKEVIEQIKFYAKGNGRSVSEMVETYFRNTVAQFQEKKPSRKKREIHPDVKKLIGRIKLPPDWDLERAKEEYHKEKYGI